uniref:E3 SUMO-protein ligase NSE2 n=2 Tax=Drosophila melanogaster TaxID=7227 RepID=Q9VVH7_DROME|nr:quijote, isoform B [Drosophila melanogaster]NP_648987.1 quijote, isoform A [Drosophila melanogaster]AOQ13738.1 qjt-PA [synthetic construct]AAF49334.2 quijote, isoform A [Drosophila melanogaster]AAW32044.1 CG13732 [Drosophila melanogaster]AAW32045.1 CG13732 [Drosophila melanogaster]AAW32047.1 CG13732 [Drosophila melanogaster]|eukprot:NP_001261988.1 quijote, isoform B [Drosophila melanogaster]
MEFNYLADSALSTLVENKKFFKEMSDFVSDFSDGGKIKKLLEQSVEQSVEHAVNVVHMKIKHQSLNKAMNQVKNSSATIEEFEEVWKERSKAVEQKRINVKNLHEFKNFVKAVESAAGQAGAEVNDQANGTAYDEDLIMEDSGSEVFSFYDPWSKALIKNPMRNKMCGHIYDRDSVMPIIMDRIGIRCPVLGCANLCYIQPDHLVQDANVQQKIQQSMSNAIVDVTASEEDEE